MNDFYFINKTKHDQDNANSTNILQTGKKNWKIRKTYHIMILKSWSYPIRPDPMWSLILSVSFLKKRKEHERDKISQGVTK